MMSVRPDAGYGNVDGKNNAEPVQCLNRGALIKKINTNISGDFRGV
jgi:hypothetical protein